MTRLATTPAILGILVSGMVAGHAGCSSNGAGLGPQQGDAHAPAPDAAAGHGGVGGAGRDAPAAGSGGNGGVSESGGVTAIAGSTQLEAGAGGSPPTGGGTGGVTQVGGATQQGGATGAGGTMGTAGVTTSVGGTQAGGATTSGGGAGNSGGTRTGGTTAASGTPRTGGATEGSGGTIAGGATGSGGTIPTGGTTGIGGTGGRICGAGLKSCLANEFCEMPTGLCASLDATGTCVVNAGVMCPADIQQVCGCNGKTYPNDCYRQLAGVSKRSDGACADAGVGGSTGTGGSGATGGTGGTTSTGGVGGSSGGHPECVTDADCQLFSDCCSCLSIPKDTIMVPCTPATCIATACTLTRIQASDVACIAGRCTFSRACKSAGGACPAAPPTPVCPAGQALLFVGNCPGGGCAKVEDCSEVASCDVCTAAGLSCATFETMPPSYHCVSTPHDCVANPTCACMGICSGGMSCDTPNSTKLTCQCPEC